MGKPKHKQHTVDREHCTCFIASFMNLSSNTSLLRRVLVVAWNNVFKEQQSNGHKTYNSTCQMHYICTEGLELYMHIYRIRFNFCRVKLSRMADFSNFCVFTLVDAGSYSLIHQFIVSSESLPY